MCFCFGFFLMFWFILWLLGVWCAWFIIFALVFVDLYAFALIVPHFFGFFPFVGDCIVRTNLLNVWIVQKTFHQSIWVFEVPCFKLEKYPSSWEFVLSFPNLWHRVLVLQYYGTNELSLKQKRRWTPWIHRPRTPRCRGFKMWRK